MTESHSGLSLSLDLSHFSSSRFPLHPFSIGTQVVFVVSCVMVSSTFPNSDTIIFFLSCGFDIRFQFGSSR